MIRCDDYVNDKDLERFIPYSMKIYGVGMVGNLDPFSDDEILVISPK